MSDDDAAVLGPDWHYLGAERRDMVVAMANAVAAGAAARAAMDPVPFIDATIDLIRAEARPRDPEAWGAFEDVVRRLALALVEGRAPSGTSRLKGEVWPRLMQALAEVYGEPPGNG